MCSNYSGFDSSWNSGPCCPCCKSACFANFHFVGICWRSGLGGGTRNTGPLSSVSRALLGRVVRVGPCLPASGLCLLCHRFGLLSGFSGCFVPFLFLQELLSTWQHEWRGPNCLFHWSFRVKSCCVKLHIGQLPAIGPKFLAKYPASLCQCGPLCLVLHRICQLAGVSPCHILIWWNSY